MKKPVRNVLALAGTLLTGASLPAAAATIDFEGLPTATAITNQIAGVTISAAGGIGQAWVYNASTAGADPDLTAPHTEVGGGPTLVNTGNVLIVQENNDGTPDDNGGGGSLFIDFDNPVTMQSMDVFDQRENSTVKLLDSTGLQLGLFSLLDTDTSGSQTDNNLYQHLVFGDIANVSRIEVTMIGSGAIDNVSYVPLPAAAWLFGSALFGLLAVARRRQG